MSRKVAATYKVVVRRSAHPFCALLSFRASRAFHTAARHAAFVVAPWLVACGGAAVTPPAPRPLDEVPSVAEEAAREAAAPARTLTVIGTADLHGHLEQLPLLAGYVEAVRAQGPVLLIDGGDMWQGTLASNMTEGAAVVQAYDALDYDAATIGNHEFDYGPVGDAATCDESVECDPRGALLARASEADFPLLAANIRYADGRALDWPGVTPSVMLERGGVRIGVVGITTGSTLQTTNIANVGDLQITPLAEAVTREATRLKEQGAEVIVVAAHAGGECTAFEDPDDLTSCEDDSEIFEMARALPEGLVQVVVAGHTHKAIAHRVAGVAIISSWALGTHFGRVDIRLEEGAAPTTAIRAPEALCALNGEGAAEGNEDAADDSEAAPCAYEAETIQPSETMAEVVAPAIEAANSRLSEQLGPELSAAFARSYDQESAAGNLLADALSAVRPNADVALLNAGGVRADFPAGPLTYEALYEVFPFDNLFATVTLRAEQLAAMIAHNAAASGGVLILGKVRAEIACGPDGMTVVLRDSRGRRIPSRRRLTLVTSDYLATTSLFSALDEGAVVIERGGPLMREALADWFRSQGSHSFAPERYLDTRRPRLAFPTPRPVRCPVVE